MGSGAFRITKEVSIELEDCRVVYFPNMILRALEVLHSNKKKKRGFVGGTEIKKLEAGRSCMSASIMNKVKDV